MEQASNDKAALRALMDLVLAVADVLEAPTATQRAKAAGRMAAERREVEGWRERDCERLEAVRTARRSGAVVSDGQQAKAAVEATVRRWEAYTEKARRREIDKVVVSRGSEGVGVRPSRWMLMQELRDLGKATVLVDPIEADDSRVTDGHSCCGGKPDCGCRSVGG